MIKFENVSYSYPKANQPILNKITFSLPEGEFALLVGASGVGKSTLLRCLNGLVPHFTGGVLSGQIEVNQLNPVMASPKIMSHHVGFVFQDPENQFVMDRVEDELAFALENAAMPPQDMRIRVEEVLDLLDLAPLRNRPLENLSGGEKQRVAIASALALHPKILVLDEPTSQLDPKSAEDVLQALVRLNHDLGLTIVLAEHRLERVLAHVDYLIYLPSQGEDLLVGSPRDLLSDLSLVPPLIQVARTLSWHPLPLTIKEGRRFSRRLKFPSKKEPSAIPTIQPSQSPYLELRRIEVAYDEQPILRQVSLTVSSGEIVALMGRNGSGKTSLLKSLVGLVPLQGGQINVAGESIAGQNVADICRKVGYLPQNPNALLFAETVLDELLITLRNYNLTPQSAPISPQKLLTSLGLADKASAYPRDLSVGERQRVALGAITITQPQALLLDEPTRGLDYQAKQQLAELLYQWREKGLAIMVVTHDVELAAQIADRVVLLSQGEVIADGSSHEVLATSPLFAPQIAHLFPNSGWLTAKDAITNLSNSNGDESR